MSLQPTSTLTQTRVSTQRHQSGGTHQVTGFNPTAGDTLELMSLLAEANVTTCDIAQLSNYLTLAAMTESASIYFDPTGRGGGPPIAILTNDGGTTAQI